MDDRSRAAKSSGTRQFAQTRINFAAIGFASGRVRAYRLNEDGCGLESTFMRIVRSLGPLIVALLLQGCAAAGLTLASAGASAGLGAGIDHTFNGIVYKTFALPLNQVRFATLRALDRMAMPVTADARSDDGWKLSATATDRIIDIELQQLTARTTRMRVIANEGMIFLKDSSTATEIILQTAQILNDDAAKAAADRRHRKAS